MIYYRVKFKDRYSKTSYITYYSNIKYYFILFYNLNQWAL